jgi:SAM-dependent methyltransferase
MIVYTPSRDSGDAERTLATLVRPRLNPLLFTHSIQKLHRMFSAYSAFCPPPWASRNLHITPEITYQSELWLPLNQLRPHFHNLYRQALTYPPVLSSTPFAQGTSWASLVADFPVFLKHFRNPAELLEELLADDQLRLGFLFWSFMPGRFYGGGSDRYPGQTPIIADWVQRRQSTGKRLRCLDVASGDGANTYGMARVLVEQGWSPDSYEIEGWTLEPLEAWTAAHGRFPHDPVREAFFREETKDCFEQGLNTAIRFGCADILTEPETAPFDLILCNGLLGGPIIHNPEIIRRIVTYLSRRLVPGGMLLAADHFHGGWKKNIPGEVLGDAFKASGLSVAEAGEGISGTRI